MGPRVHKWFEKELSIFTQTSEETTCIPDGKNDFVYHLQLRSAGIQSTALLGGREGVISLNECWITR